MHRVVPFLIALLVLASCGSSSDSAQSDGSTTSAAETAPSTVATPSTTAADGTTTTPPTSTEAPTSTAVATTTTSTPACGTGGDLTLPSQNRTLTTSNGVERTWLLALPTGYEHGTPAPVVFNLHGAGSNGAEQYVYGNYIAQAEAEGAMLVMPEALEVNGRPAWNPGEIGSGEDLDFVAELIDVIRSEYCTSSFFATGMSSGGFMTSALACWADGPFEGFGPVTLAFYAPDECGDAPSQPFMYFHGTADDTVPFEGNDPGLDAAPVTAQEWADHNGCDPEPVEERVSDEVVHFTWEGCSATTEFYVVEEGGHTWPGALAIESFGHTTDDISASDLIWDMFFG
ncbi:MAG: alpha/beta hydrolase family esterase [Acidimicrobiales bacterium]